MAKPKAKKQQPSQEQDATEHLRDIYKQLIAFAQDFLIIGFLHFVWLISGSYAVLGLLVVILFCFFWFTAELAISRSRHTKDKAHQIAALVGSGIALTASVLWWLNIVNAVAAAYLR